MEHFHNRGYGAGRNDVIRFWSKDEGSGAGMATFNSLQSNRGKIERRSEHTCVERSSIDTAKSTETVDSEEEISALTKLGVQVKRKKIMQTELRSPINRPSRKMRVNSARILWKTRALGGKKEAVTERIGVEPQV